MVDYGQSPRRRGLPFELITGNHESNGLDGNIDAFAACLPNNVPGLVGTYGKQWYVDVPASNPVARFVMISPGLKFPERDVVLRRGTPRYAWTCISHRRGSYSEDSLGRRRDAHPVPVPDFTELWVRARPDESARLEEGRPGADGAQPPLRADEAAGPVNDVPAHRARNNISDLHRGCRQQPHPGPRDGVRHRGHRRYGTAVLEHADPERALLLHLGWCWSQRDVGVPGRTGKSSRLAASFARMCRWYVHGLLRHQPSHFAVAFVGIPIRPAERRDTSR